MKLKDALKKFNFLKRLDISEAALHKVANHLALCLKGSEEKFVTPLAAKNDHFHLLCEWEIIYEEHFHLINEPLAKLELSNSAKFGPRSMAAPWSERLSGLKLSFTSQDVNHIPKFCFELGNNVLMPTSLEEATARVRGSSSAGLPFVTKKAKSLQSLLDNFDEILARKDPCLIYTRTAEQRKTRNVWGYPFALTLFELRFYIPILGVFKRKPYRTSLVGPDALDISVTRLIKKAIAESKLLYSVDLAAFDARVKYQYIIKAFDVIKSYYDPFYHEFLNYICEQMYSIGIVTPTGIYRGKHGVPSGATFTNEVDSIVQLGIALTCNFISEEACEVQGDDGLYLLQEHNIAEFEEAFKYAGMKLEKSKCIIASNHALFCQRLYHIDYMSEEGHIGGIYPTFRALNRLLFQEKFIDFGRVGLKGKDYFAIRTLTILENCKHHPLFEQFVRFILTKEQRSLDVSDDSLSRYVEYLNKGLSTTASLNQQTDDFILGIRNFESYKLIQKIITEEGFAFSEDVSSLEEDSISPVIV